MATVSFPARCAVAVICGDHLVSQVYPASVPVEVFIDSVVELLSDDLKRRGLDGLDPGVAYELQRANGTRLDVRKTLDELGVEDGATLILVPAEEGDPFEPQYESLSTGLARIGKRIFAPVTADTAARTALTILAMTVLTLVGLAAYTRVRTDSWVPAAVTGVVGMGLVSGAFAVWRWWPDREELLDSVTWLAIPVFAVGFAAAPPGAVGSAHLFIGGLTIVVSAAALLIRTDRRTAFAAGVVTAVGIGTAIAAARMWRPVPAQWLGMCTLVALLFLLTLAPTFALWAARLRPPHFGSITGRDLFRRNDGMPVDAVAPVDEEAVEETDPDTTPRGASIAAAARRANGVLTGICVGLAVVFPVAVWMTLMPGQPRGTAAAVLVGLFVVILISRARAFADRRQAVTLVCGAAAGVCAAAARSVIQQQGMSLAALFWAAVIVIGFGAAALAAALLVPVTRFTPLVRMVTEWAELVAIVAALPLAAWIGGLFTWVRMR